jgi:nudix-type nucleoside diphosphatase (YffH/AdpP family)
MNAEPAILGREQVYGGWNRLYRLSVRMPDGRTVERHLEDHGSAAAVLPYDATRRVALLVVLPRPPLLAACAPPMLEAPAGNLDGASGEDCARREAFEETGVVLRDLDHVATIWSLPSLSTERLALYLGRYEATDRTAAGGGAFEENEGISVEEVPLARLGTMLAEGAIEDPKALICIQALMLRRPDLFA